MYSSVKNDFKMLEKKIIYFDSASTTYKPNVVVDSVLDYYTNCTANISKYDYDPNYSMDVKFEGIRNKIKNFINADRRDEIIFTSGTTQSLNMVTKGFFENYLNDGDEVLLTEAEHASNIIPWFEINKNIDIKYIDLENGIVTLNNVIRAITNKTKVISIAHISNLYGDERPIKEITEYAHKHNILVVLDAAQSISNIKVDVKELDIDFMAFSGHKMCGPTGTGILYGKHNLLEQMKPQNFGGEINHEFKSTLTYKEMSLPTKLENGTQNISGIIGLSSAVDYLNKIGIDNINKYVLELRNYALEKMKKLDNIEIYNDCIESNIILFNVKGVHSEDTTIYLRKKNIYVSVFNYCKGIEFNKKIINKLCRASFYFYNSKEEIDKLIAILDNRDIIKESIL